MERVMAVVLGRICSVSTAGSLPLVGVAVTVTVPADSTFLAVSLPEAERVANSSPSVISQVEASFTLPGIR